jgi:hypothetical protein
MLNYTTTNDTQQLDCLIFYFPHSALKGVLLRVVHRKARRAVSFCFLVGVLPSNGGSLPELFHYQFSIIHYELLSILHSEAGVALQWSIFFPARAGARSKATL